jgi:hypothetical protein
MVAYKDGTHVQLVTRAGKDHARRRGWSQSTERGR